MVFHFLLLCVYSESRDSMPLFVSQSQKYRSNRSTTIRFFCRFSSVGDAKDWLLHLTPKKREKERKMMKRFSLAPAKRHWGIGKTIHRTREQLHYIYISRCDGAAALYVSTFIDSVTSTRFRPSALIITVKGIEAKALSLQNIYYSSFLL